MGGEIGQLAAIAAIRPRGTIVQVGVMGGGSATFPLGALLPKRASIVGTVLRGRPLEEKVALTQRFEREVLPWFAEGRLRPVPDAAIAARLLIETTAWFAWHRLGDPAPQPMDDSLARETVIAVLSRGLLPEGCS